MDFLDLEAKTRTWCSGCTTNFAVVDRSETERKLTLSSGNISFFLLLPEDTSKNINVWSDNEEVLPYIGELVDRLSGCKRLTIEETLNLINKKLAPMFGASNNVDNDDDEGISDDSYNSDDGDDYDMNYADPDDDALNDVVPTTSAAAVEEQESDAQYKGQGSVVAVQRLIKDMKSLSKMKLQIGISGQPREDNLFLWDVKLVDIPPNTKLGKDVIEYVNKYKRENCILMEMSFPAEYPFQPPFVRIVRPRFQFLTGHVTIGGSICMELLTKSGWNPTNDIESVLVQIRAEILSDTNARLDSHPDREYDRSEAKLAFDRMVKRYGWE